MLKKLNYIKYGLVFCGLLSFTACSNIGLDALNPYGSEPVPGGDSGSRDNKAILQSSGNSQDAIARKALEAMSSYRRAQAPQPVYPVIQPAEVRKMWVPDHLNKAGDLVPAHYYYLKVLNDRWMVQDAFELEGQLNAGSSGGGSAVPYVIKGTK